MLDGEDIATLPTRAVARRLALLPQRTETMTGVTVAALVELGRQPHLGRFGGLRAADREAIAWALEVTDAAQHADRLIDTLSGGERQRAWLAVALAQRTGVLLLDEPTTYLDVRHQLEVMALVRPLNAEHGLTVCWVLHDLNAAAAYSDAMVCLRDGRVLAQGPPGRAADRRARARRVRHRRDRHRRPAHRPARLPAARPDPRHLVQGAP